MSNLRIYTFGLLAVMLLATSCCKQNHGNQTEQTVVILSTNDIHAAIDNFPNLASVVEDYRSQYGSDNVLLVDAGDRWTGNPYVDWATSPFLPVVQLMDSLGYDLGTLGNHCFDKGTHILDDRIGDMTFPIICANINTGSTPLRQPEPYTIIKRGGMRIGFVGVVTNSMNGHPDGNESNFEGLTFDTPLQAAERYAKIEKNCDVLVLLSHAGYPGDSIIAANTTQYDLIIGGHTHDMLSPAKIVGGTTITQTRSALRYVGVTTITLTAGKPTITNTLIKLDTITPSPRFEAMVELLKTDPALKTEIGSAKEDFDFNAIANLLTDALRTRASADVGLYHRGGIRLENIPAGSVAKLTLGLIDPFGSTVNVLPMTREQLKDLIITKYNDTGNPKESHRVDLMPSGISYKIVTDAAGEATDVLFTGLPDGATFKVAVSSYVYNNYKFSHEQAEAESEAVCDVLEWYFGINSPVAPDNTVRATDK